MHPFTNPNRAQEKVKLIPIWWLTLLNRKTDAFSELHAHAIENLVLGY